MSNRNDCESPVIMAMTISDEDERVDESSEDDQQVQVHSGTMHDLAKSLLKWTNYITGWQDRHFVLKNGILSYYKNENDTQFGCRGSLMLNQSTIQVHDLDDCRFDICVNDCVWYLRAHTKDERETWIRAIDDHKRLSSGCASDSTSLKRHPSLLSLTSVSCASIASFNKIGLTSTSLKDKLAEIDTYKDILCKQIETLQVYFDACANSMTKGYEPYHNETTTTTTAAVDIDIDDDVDLDVADVNIRQHLTTSSDYRTRVEDHAQLAYDFKGEAYTFKATAVGLLTHLSHCVDLMYQSEDMWRIKYDRQVDKRRQLDEKYKQIINQKNSEISALTSTRTPTTNQTCLMAPIMGATPDFEEGPHSAMRDEQFFDAIDSTLDNMDLEESRRLEAKNNLKAIEQLGNSCRNDDHHHPLASTIKRIVDEHILIDRQELTDIWELFASDGEMKLYRREIEDNGIVIDPIKAVHMVNGVTGYEVCKYFWDPKYRMDWETTLDSTRVIEVIDDQTLVFHQIHKKVWPAAQRDLCFWSHMRPIYMHNDNDRPDWIVCNYSIPDHESAPLKEPMIRAVLNVAMTCQTIVTTTSGNQVAPTGICRANLQCKITYVAQVNPGGWLPAAALRTVYKREYPKFLKRFTHYVIEQTSKVPIKFEA